MQSFFVEKENDFMRITDMIMVLNNDRGYEKGVLMIYLDYLEQVVFEKTESINRL